MATAKRPLLPKDDRKRLALMAGQAAKVAHRDDSPSRAYAKGVEDTLLWLIGTQNPTPLFEEVTS